MTNLIKILIQVLIFMFGLIISGTIATLNKKKNTKLKKVVKLAQIVQKIPDYIEEAEKYYPSTETTKYGWAKLNHVLNKVHMDCIQMGIEYNESQIKGEIEKILETPQKKEESNG